MADGEREFGAGDVLGERYVVEERLGAGGMGVVYAATDRKLKRRVALKTLGRKVAGSTRARSRLRTEAEAVASLAHPGIVTLFDIIDTDDGVVLVMELVPGESLRHALAQGALPVARVRSIIAGVADALAAAHERGLVHRDVKPDNVVVRPDGRTALLDFGVAKAVGPIDEAAPTSEAALVTAEGVILGTPAYLSPEQARGEVLTPASDQFALAVLAFELLTGELPWPTASRTTLLAAIFVQSPPSAHALRAELPHAVDDVLERALAKTPSGRFPSVTAFAHAIEEALAHASPSSAPARAAVHRTLTAAKTETAVVTRVTDVPARAGRRTRRVAAVATAAILAGAITIAVAWRARLTPAARSAASAQSASGSDAESHRAPDAIVYAEIPYSTSSTPEAIGALREALPQWSTARTRDAARSLDRALALDPELASARLQRALVGNVLGTGLEDESRKDLAIAAAHRAQLTDRDRKILDAVTPGFTDPPDWREEARRLEALAASGPCDAQLLDLLGCVRTKLSEHPAAMKAFEREAACDPRATASYPIHASMLETLGEHDASRRMLDDCIARDPTSSECREQQLARLAEDGACAEMQSRARDYSALVPDSANAFSIRAAAAAGSGEPAEAIADLLQKKWGLLPERDRAIARFDDEVQLSCYQGDYASALARLTAQDDRDTSLEARRAVLRAALLSESGDAASAGRIANEFLRRAAARPTPESILVDRVLVLAMFARDGGVFDDAEFERRRAAWLAGWRERLGAEGWREYSSWIWNVAFAIPARTRKHAEHAIAAAADFGGLPPRGYGWVASAGETGEVLRLVGRLDEAIEHLEARARICTFDDFDFVIDLHAGRAREARGNLAEACRWYARVAAHWGAAKPRSLAGDEAKRALVRLHCPR